MKADYDRRVIIILCFLLLFAGCGRSSDTTGGSSDNASGYDAGLDGAWISDMGVILEFEITRIDLPEVDFRVVCSKGTYIRSLANDFGKALGSGAYLSALRRTKIGDYNVDNATTPQEFKESLA